MLHKPQPLLEFFELVRNVNREDFEESFTHPFLVQATPTASVSPSQYTTSRLERERLIAGMNELLAQQVFPVAKRPGNAFTKMINAGRAKNNDIVLPFDGVSKFHAYIEKDEATGTHRLNDAGSTNRTFVNYVELKPDNPQPLKSGDVVSFSRRLVFTFYTPGGLFDWVKGLVDEAERLRKEGGKGAENE